MRAGILIIGSLLWDNEYRSKWRRSHLCVESKFHVKTPIRYGRRSASRGNTFTMTFRTDCVLGQAVLVPCSRQVKDVSDLVSEATALWKAEQSSAANSIGACWGCVGVAFRADNPSTALLVEWHKYFRSKISSTVSPVDEEGILHIPWPIMSAKDRPVDVDLLLATVTRAEINQPTVDEIVDAWVGQCDCYERYFFENVRNGIRTADDCLIWRRIEERSPGWLKGGVYDEAVEVLQAEADQSV